MTMGKSDEMTQKKKSRQRHPRREWCCREFCLLNVILHLMLFLGVNRNGLDLPTKNERLLDYMRDTNQGSYQRQLSGHR